MEQWRIHMAEIMCSVCIFPVSPCYPLSIELSQCPISIEFGWIHSVSVRLKLTTKYMLNLQLDIWGCWQPQEATLYIQTITHFEQKENNGVLKKQELPRSPIVSFPTCVTCIPASHFQPLTLKMMTQRKGKDRATPCPLTLSPPYSSVSKGRESWQKWAHIKK